MLLARFLKWFVPNPLDKFTVSPRDNLKANPDGSITLYFQNESPGKDKEAKHQRPHADGVGVAHRFLGVDRAPAVRIGAVMAVHVDRTVDELVRTHPGRRMVTAKRLKSGMP